MRQVKIAFTRFPRRPLLACGRNHPFDHILFSAAHNEGIPLSAFEPAVLDGEESRSKRRKDKERRMLAPDDAESDLSVSDGGAPSRARGLTRMSHRLLRSAASQDRKSTRLNSSH